MAADEEPTGAPVSPYGFSSELPAEFPSQVNVDSTEVCNLACVVCPHPTFKRSAHYAGRMLEPELNAKLVDEIAANGRGHTRYLRYSGSGEPLIHPRIFEMLDRAVRLSETRVTLTTNGTLLDESRAERLLATGLAIVDISIDALAPETYAAVRVNGDLTTTAENVRRLIRLSRGSRTRVVVSYVEQELNRGETVDFERYWRDQGADFVVIRRCHSNAGATTAVADLLRRTAAKQQRRPCLYPWERILLNPRGELSFCPDDWVHGSVIADYRETTIVEAWRGEFYRRLRAAHLRNDFAGHSFCGQCPDWQATRWPFEGRRYAHMIEDLRGGEPGARGGEAG